MYKGVKRKRFIERDAVGVARVILRTDSDRAEFIKHCYQTSTISIVARENFDVMHEVEVDPEVLQRINFPAEDELGSTVVWVNVPHYNRPIIVAIINNKNEMSHFEEGEFAFRKDGEDGTVSIQGLARGAQININATSTTKRGGAVRINIGNLANEGKLEVTISGSLFLDAISATSNFRDFEETNVWDGEADSKKTFRKVTNDQVEERIKESTSGHKFDEEVYEIGDGGVTAVIAEELEKFQHDVIDELAKSTTTTSLGTMPLLNAAQITALKQKTSAQYSQYLKIQ